MNASDRFMGIPSPCKCLVAATRQPQEHLPKEGHPIWLFVGDVEPGCLAADLFTVVSSAVRNDLDVFVYVKDVLDRLLSGETDYEALRPDAWKRTHPEAEREYRAEERAARADVKKARRARRRASRG